MFKTEIFDQINTNLQKEFINTVNKERKGEKITFDVLKSFIGFLVSIQVKTENSENEVSLYLSDFEVTFINRNNIIN